MRPERGGAEPGRNSRRGEEAGLEGRTPDEQVPADRELPAQHRRLRRKRLAFGDQRADEQHAADDLGRDVGDGRTGEAKPGRVDQHRAEHTTRRFASST